VPPRCEIDADLLIEALTRPLDGEAHLDPDSGEVFLGDVFDEEDEERESQRDDLITITRVETGDEYARMVEFADAIDRAQLRVAGRHIELAIAVTPELWRRFGG
jgi:phenylpropionate dioxygenase-like ring-hydroxylating dioxygenase large terminal subunit